MGDSDHAAVSARGSFSGDDIDNDEFDSAVTSGFTKFKADATSVSIIGANLADATGSAPIDSASLPPTDDAALKTGFLLRDRFEIVELVHSGGMGHVYKAIDKRRHLGGSDQIHVAIKMTRRSVAPQIDARFALEREAAKTQALSHPNIVNIYDFDQHDEQFYLVMEWLEGESVNALLRRTSGQRIAPKFAWQVIEGVASALQHAHSHDVVHADINPSNIFITDTQEIKLLDFGVARYSSDPIRAPDDEFIWATRTYASPEVLSGSTPTFEDDVFSLACVAYRLLSGTHPFAGKTSLEAKRAEASVTPIPGLSAARWQMLSRALAYAKSERPTTLDAFFADSPAESGSDLATPAAARRPRYWWGVLPVAIALLAGVWWLSQGDLQNYVAAMRATPPVDNTPTVAIEAPLEPSELDKLLSSAMLAVDEERFLLPKDDNARDWYRKVLSLDPANSIALSGLRLISDVFVRQADTALRDDDPIRAIVALATAAETDSANPAIAIVNELLLAQGNGQLASARLAAAEGDADQAADWLSKAERYTQLDAQAIKAVRDQIGAVRNQAAQAEQQFLAKLDDADAYIATGRLIAPAGDNAQVLLTELQHNFGPDVRLLASMERLAEGLLSAAASASIAERYPEATELLNAADELGVLPTEVAATRMALQRAMDNSRDASVPSANSTPTELTTESPMEKVARLVRASAESEVDIPAAYAVAEPASLSATSSNRSGSTNAGIADSGLTQTDESSQVNTIPLSELDFEKYVAPQFPRRASRRGLTGVVELKFNVNPDGSTGAIETLHAEPDEVFVGSAENAVQKWRFTPRDDVITTRVKLRFEQQ